MEEEPLDIQLNEIKHARKNSNITHIVPNDIVIPLTSSDNGALYCICIPERKSCGLKS